MAYVLACDVDGVVVDMFTHWFEHLREVTGIPVDITTAAKFYDLHIPFAGKITQEAAWAWWKSADLYDNVTPITGAIQALRRFKDAGFDIVFVTHVEGNHAKSKFDMLKRFFPFMDGYIATREKGYVRADVIIDDRSRNLASFPGEVITVQMMTPHAQDTIFHPDFVLDDWSNDFAIDEIISVTKKTAPRMKRDADEVFLDIIKLAVEG